MFSAVQSALCVCVCVCVCVRATVNVYGRSSMSAIGLSACFAGASLSAAAGILFFDR